jgi:autotransporter-associated beta strand protein
VTQSRINPLVFDITIAGVLLPPAAPQPQTPPAPQTLMTARGTGIPNPVVTPASTWVNLTQTATTPRLTLNGQAGAPPGTPGPNDDFRVSFPQVAATWSDLTLAYFDDSNPLNPLPPPAPGGGFGVRIPVLYASLGGNADLNNAVFRTENPNLAPISAVPTTWYMGDPGVPQNEIQQLKVSPWQNGGFYQLRFNGSAWSPPIGDPTFPFGIPAATDAFVGLGNTATTIEGILNGLPTIGGVGGSVNVILDTASTSTTLLFDITFGGTLSDSQQPLIQEMETNPPPGDWVTITETQQGSGVDTRSAGEFPIGVYPPAPHLPYPRNGNIKITSVTSPHPIPGRDPAFNQVTLYATISYPDDAVHYPNTPNQFREVLVSTDGGKSWADTTGQPPNFLGQQGYYDSTILALGPNRVLVGGQESDNVTHSSQIWFTPDGGVSWGDFSNVGRSGPHTSQHAVAEDSLGRVIFGGDGGVWRLDFNSGTWTDLNGNLAIAQFNSVAGSPSDPGTVLGGSRFNGNDSSGGLAWTQNDANDGGEVRVNPLNPNIVYHVQSASDLPTQSSTLWESTSGGSPGSWFQLTPLDAPFSARYFPVALDNINPNRIVLGGGDSGGVAGGGRRLWDFTGVALQESMDGGNSWIDLTSGLDGVNTPPPFPPPPQTVWYEVTALALASYQGTFQADPGFSQVTDRGANTYDPDTIYAVENDYVAGVQRVVVTKNQGVSWKDRTPASVGSIVDIEVDPTNRDTAYVVSNASSGEILKTTNAGRNWTNITANLPNLPVWKVVIDPRYGNVYAATDDGVWLLPQGSSTWQRFGAGLANVQVRDLELNQATNSLLAGTYGRSVYRLTLSDGLANAGALRAVSGTSVWTGPILLAGDPVTNTVAIAANGSHAVENGITTASLNLLGSISDLTANSNPRLDKLGLGDVILSAGNTYGGVTEVVQGNLVSHNPQALGLPTAPTIVDSGAALELAADLQLEPVTLNGDGVQPPFNGHNTGALRNISSNNTYTGTLTLGTDTTIGVDSGTTLTIGTKPGLLGTGMITDNNTNHQLSKESTGTLILASANTYGGKTEIDQGVLQIQNGQALGSTAGGTDVFDGAQLQIQTPTTGQPVVVSGEALTLSGTGIFNTGALLDTGGNNTWRGPITLDSKPFLLLPNNVPATRPGPEIAIGVTNASDNLTIDGPVGETGGHFGITKVGPGRVILTHADTYTGTTDVAAGELRIQDGGALGSSGTTTTTGVQILPTNNGGNGYTGLDFAQTQGFVPPDSNGAAGPSSYINTVNQVVAIFTPKASGTTEVSDTFDDFFYTQGGLAPTSGFSFQSDPIVVYDELIGKFIIGDQDVDFFNHISNFDIAVSKTSDPTTLTAADWNFYQISTTEGSFDADYPGNFGYNKDAFVFTLNMFGPFNVDHVLVTSVNADDLANGVPQASLRSFQNDFAGASLRPTTMHGSAANDPMWLLEEGGDSQSINVVKMTNVLSNTATFTTFNLPVTPYVPIVQFTSGLPLNPDGSVVVSNIDSRIMKAASSNGTLVATHHVSTAAGNQDVAQWYNIDISTGTPVLHDQGDISAGPDTYIYYPGIDINPAGDIGMSFMQSGTDSPTDFMSMWVTGRTPTDPAGIMEAPVLVPAGAGQANYADFAQRAGDMSGINIDPVDGTFWAVNEFANTEAGANWGQAIANFMPGGSTTTHFGGAIVETGAALELDADPTGTGASITVAGVPLTLNGIGVGGTGALRNVSGNNTYGGSVTLATNTSIGTDPGTQLTVTGTVQDPTPTPVPAASLTKVGTGTLVFPNANTYSGKTIVAAGVLNIRDGSALGAGGPEQQSVTVLGAGGTFELNFGGQTTIALDILSPTLAADMQAALVALSSIGGVGGTVTVTQGSAPDTNVFTITFGGSLAGENLPQITSTVSPGVSAVVRTVRDGPEGTVVNRGATLQVQGNITVSSEPLTLNGTGLGNAGALENVSGFSDTWAAPIVLGSDSSIGVDGPADTLSIPATITDNGGGFGVTKVGAGTVDYAGIGDNTYTGLTRVNQGTLLLDKTPASEVQTVTVLGSSGTFTLTFNGQTTGALAHDVPASGGGTATSSMQNALNALSSIGGVGGSVTVTQSGNVYTVTFGGNLANSAEPLMTGTGAGGATPVVATQVQGNAAPQAFEGDLAIGDNQPGNATVRWMHSNQVPDTSTVTVNSDGLLDLNGQTDTIGALVMVDGRATTGASGSGRLTVGSLSMSGGTFTLATSGGRLILAGDVTATSDTNQTATINGPGQVSLGGATRTFTVNDGPRAVDLDVASVVSGTGGEGLIKQGTGRMELDAVETYTGATTIDQGDVQVDGTVGSVVLAGGTLSGNGTVGTVGGPANVSGTVSPGDNGSANPIGTLHTQTVTLGSGSTLFVNLAHTSVGNPVPGVDNDLLAVTGDIYLNGASLAGLVAASVNLGDTFTIIQTTGGTVHNKFAEPFSPNTAFVAGQKFTVDYSDPTKVVLRRVKDTATVTITSSANPSVYGQQVLFTATVTPEPGAVAIPTTTTDTVTFTFDGVTYSPEFLTANPDGSAYAVFDPLAATGGPMSVTTPLTLHTLHAAFSGDATLYDPANGDLSPAQEVDKANTFLNISSTRTTSVFGQTVTIIAAVRPIAPGAGTPSGTVTFTVNGTQYDENVDGSGNAHLDLTGLAVGGYSATATYNGDGNFNTSSTQRGLSLTVNRDSSTVHLSSNLTTAVAGQTVVFTATISVNPFAPPAWGPGATPSGTVQFFDGQTPVDTENVTFNSLTNHYEAVCSTNTLSIGIHTIRAEYSGNQQLNGNSDVLPVNVTKITTVTTLTASAPVWFYHQTITFTATVTRQSPGTGVPAGTVTFYDTDTNHFLASGNLDVNGVASFQISTLPLGTHNIFAVYGGSPVDFTSTSNILSQPVVYASTTSVVSSLNPAQYGQSVTFTATVVAGPGTPAGAPVPTGSVSFFDNGSLLNTINLDTTGHARYSTSSLGLGSHPITAIYSGSSFYAAGSAALTQSVLSPTTTTVRVDINPSTYGQVITFTTAVVATAPGAPTPTGNVTFLDGSNPLTTTTLDGSGHATFSTALLSAGPHTIKVQYVGDGTDAASTSAVPVNQTVRQDGTSMTLTTSSGLVGGVPTSTYGEPVTFTATVTQASPGTLKPVGSVVFHDGSTVLATVSLNASGVATCMTQTLAAGRLHAITATYAGNTNFGPSTGVVTGGQFVTADGTTMAVTASPSTAFYSQPVTFTATLSPVGPGTLPPSGVPVIFREGSSVLATVNTNSSGVATYTTSTLPLGGHTITASFAGNTNYTGSSNSASTSVIQDGSTTTLTSSPNPSNFGQVVTFTATVKAASPGIGVPGGSVSFSVDGGAAQTKTLNASGVATLALSNLARGFHTITVSYAGNANYSGSGNSLTQVVRAQSAISLASSLNPAFVNQSITFTAVVAPVNRPSGFPMPTGTVTFYDGSAVLATAVPIDPTTGVATFTTSALGVATHSISAKYNGDGYYTTVSSGAIAQRVLAVPASVRASITAPTIVTPNQAFTVTALLYDGSGNQINDSIQTATISYISGPGSLTGAGTVAFVGGKFTFSGLTVTARGTYTLRVTTSSGLFVDLTFTTGSRITG